jgi:trypsin
MEQTYLCGILALILVTINGNPIDSEIERPGRIVDGRVEAPGEITYGASLQYSGGFSFCGGTLIKEGWVVTAAHCSRNK